MPERKPTQNKSQQNTPTTQQTHHLRPRERLVLGGNLSGIPNKRRTDFISRYFRANMINSIAIILISLIAIAFFWPQKNNTVKEVINAASRTGTFKLPPQTIYTESRVDRPSNTGGQGFSRDSDVDRANEYRRQDALELQIRELITDAEQHVQNGRYTEPKNANALLSYRQILTLDPRNIAARRGIEYILGRFLETGFEALNNGKLQQASTILKKLSTIDQNSSEYSELNNTIARYKLDLANIASFLEKAKEAFAQNRLLSPANANALYFYQQILQIDQQNKEALSGITSIANVYIQKATEQTELGNFEQATSNIATVKVIEPNHPQIERIQNRINTAKQISAKLQIGTLNDPTPRPSTAKTPAKEAQEQQVFDNEYLKQGLQAYRDRRYSDAIALLQPLADKGISRAQYKLGYMIYFGQGIARNRSNGISIIRKSLPAITQFADEGRNWAQVNLGSLYENGIVLPRDLKQALFWYKSAADQGLAEAQTKLGVMYRRGRGVATSRRTAIEWFQRAAKQGDPEASRNLRQMGVSR